MENQVINFGDKFDKFTDQWSPKIIAQLNDYHFKLARIEGEFNWHSHKETDEAFIIIAGSMQIELPDQTINLNEGEMYIVPKGVQHKPIAGKECKILLIEPAGTINTGDSSGKTEGTEGSWI